MRVYHWLKAHPLVCAAVLPMLIMAVYFIARGVYPFGNSSVLTVDMGQQYIDFYAYFRSTVFGHPGQLFYSFSNALGGDMYGTFAYYLLSPYNLVLLLFPKTMLDVAVAVMTLLKYGSAGLALAYYLKTTGWRSWWLPAWGTAYALSGWMLANQLNLMWFDGAICLPLIAVALANLVAGRRPFAYIGWLAAAIVVNYYIAFMLCLFLVGYFGYEVVRQWAGWRWFARQAARFAAASVAAAGLAAVIVIPTLVQLRLGKGTYTTTDFHWRFEYAPYRQLGKFMLGAFNFDQMPSGQANVFIGAIGVLGAVLFFTQRTIPLRERLFAAGWSLFLTLSVMVEPLDLLWHGLQFPSWYPYRFSFVICFWLLVLAGRALQGQPTGLTWWQMLLTLGLVLAVIATVWLNLAHFSYLTEWQVGASALFGIAAVILLTIRHDGRAATAAIFAVFMVIDSTANMVTTLNQLSYISHSDYHTYTESLRAGVAHIQATDSGTYRIGKTVTRTKNDAMQVGYMGTDQFNSMMAPPTVQLFEDLGQSENDGFVGYTNGTVITDALLDLKYWLTPRPTPAVATGFLPSSGARPDVSRYDELGHTGDLTVSRNPNALGLGFVASTDILKTKRAANLAMLNQELILTHLAGQPYRSLFDLQTMTGPKLHDATIKKQTQVVTKVTDGATVTYTFTAHTTDPYYLQIPVAFSDNVVTLTQNGNDLPIPDSFRSSILLNVTPTAPGEKQTLTLTLQKSTADLTDVALYRLNAAATTALLTPLRQNPWHITHRSDTSLRGTVTVEAKHKLLMTTIPAVPGWRVTVDGQPATISKALKYFIAIRLKPGQHTVAMTYRPPALGLGAAISLASAALVGAWWWCTPTGRHRRHG
ncbi:YfhO family protein [Lacticaseibacillus nasuensis]|uniref:YfhO family protein n=1 Tax=Lacticaseibacillus nasuensis TaxID=944671 RepID=UPI002245EC3B|nr:YfhO family protein [Lacticaseibacillus nasuensis]MCX2454767.1 YfhO family protein [Lacticaseibacillus nasuensis]